MDIFKDIYKSIIANCSDTSESGGIIGVSSGIITHYEFDKPNDISECYYHPNIQNINSIIRKWQISGVEFAGIFHSHPTGDTSLSPGDEEYIREILKSVPIETLYFPIIAPNIEMRIYKAVSKSNDVIITLEPINII